ncbi:Serine/threonine-protein kinase-like protein, partial [Operophtera brumata]
MQANYPKKQERRSWDPVHITYPVRKFPTTESQIHDFEEEVRSSYERSLASLQTNGQQEHSTIQGTYAPESTQIGSRKPICAVFDPYKHMNKRLESS